jgi:hypothetical protein
MAVVLTVLNFHIVDILRTAAYPTLFMTDLPPSRLHLALRWGDQATISYHEPLVHISYEEQKFIP